VLVTTSEEAQEEPVRETRTVEVSRAGSLAEETAREFVGQVEALEEARIESETAGRVVRVPVALGEKVSAGDIIAELENDSQRAAVLQAEGAYEAALASARQSDISVADAASSLRSAESSAITTYRSAFTTVDTIIRNRVDDLFTNLDTKNPGFQLDGLGDAVEIGQERLAIEDILDTWSERVYGTPEREQAASLLDEAQANTERVAAYVGRLARIISDEDNDGAVVDGIGISTFRSQFESARAELNATLQSIENDRNALSNAAEAFERAEVGGTTGELSAANAQVKQAAGSLESARAELSKTVIRTPISGTVNLLDVSTGDFLTQFESVARVANNDALEVTTFVNPDDRRHISVGETVTVAGGYAGTVTAIAPAVDPTTRKIKVEIQTESAAIASGDTVRVRIPMTDARVSAPLRIPLTAVNFSAENAAVFSVSDGVIVKHPVTLGDVNGGFVEITDGIQRDREIVVDARGLTPGQTVTAVPYKNS